MEAGLQHVSVPGLGWWWQVWGGGRWWHCLHEVGFEVREIVSHLALHVGNPFVNGLLEGSGQQAHLLLYTIAGGEGECACKMSNYFE